MLLAPLLLAVPLASCGEDRVQTFVEPEPPPPRCGDGTVNGEDQCEGEQLGGATCQSLGFVAGTLSCASDCRFDTSKCIRTCGNGKIDFGEECDGPALGTAGCDDWGVVRCTGGCKLDATGCVATPFKEAQRLEFGAPASYALAGLGPKRQSGRTITELWVTLPVTGQIALIPWTTDLQFDTGKRRSLSLESAGTGWPTAVADLNGDGSADGLVAFDSGDALRVALTRPDGTFERTSVDLQCQPLEPLLGDFDGDGKPDALVPACPTNAVRAGELRPFLNRLAATPARLEAKSALALTEAASFFAIADADGDGRSDVLAHLPSKGAVEVWRGDGAGGFTRHTAVLAEGEVPGEFAALDADGDGDLDLLVLDAAGASLAQLINDGSGGFTRRAGVSGLSQARRLTLADVDLDGHVDVALLTA
ncbi:MAG: FG-GAP repeat domain-containing protein, partial [Myxococcales bacterium]